MRKLLHLMMEIAVVTGCVGISAAPLTLTDEANAFFSVSSGQSYAKTFVQPDNRVLDTALVVNRPVEYAVSYPQFTEGDLNRLVAAAGISGTAKKYAGYDNKRGICYFRSPDRTPLKNASVQGCAELKRRGKTMLDALLGKRSRLFVQANTETDWVLRKPDTLPRQVMYTCRYTRKVNGSHIVGNAAYVRISFTGNGEMCGFEIADPDLRPVPVERMVQPSATKTRLERFAELKNSVVSTMNKKVGITAITAEKGIRSYVLRTVDTEKRLVPCMSVLCRYQLANGGSYRKFEHFVVDAAHVSNIDESMLEPLGR